MELNIKRDDPWNTLQIPEGMKVEIGTPVFEGYRTMLIGGVPTEVASSCYGGEYILTTGETITIVDGIITEVTTANSILAVARLRKDKYRKTTK